MALIADELDFGLARAHQGAVGGGGHPPRTTSARAGLELEAMLSIAADEQAEVVSTATMSDEILSTGFTSSLALTQAMTVEQANISAKK